MQINVNFLDNLKLEALFDDFKINSDQPIRYKGDGTAPGPFDYFLASSALCAAYFVKVYCKARNIPTEGIRVYQQNLIDPNNRYKQSFNLQVELPDDINEKDRNGIIASIERCTVKRVIQNSPEFNISIKQAVSDNSHLSSEIDLNKVTHIDGKDSSLEDTIKIMSRALSEIGIQIETGNWRNLVPNVWSVHIRDADSPICFSNGKGATKASTLCSALGEYIERLSTNYFYNDYYLGEEVASSDFVHYPNEKWFKIPSDSSIPEGIMDDYLSNLYNPDNELQAEHLVDQNSGNVARGICSLPYVRQSDNEIIFIPVNLVSNLFVSNGMSAGNTKYEARVQALSEIFERAIKNKIITEEITLPDIPKEVIAQYPLIYDGIKSLEDKGYPVIVKDASLGGCYPVVCVTLLNPNNGGVFASFGAHPRFEVALERSLTELLQGRSFEGLNDIMKPTFNSFAIKEHNNIIDHFIDSTGVVSWRFFSAKPDYKFVDWNFKGSTEEEYNHLTNILTQINRDFYIADYNDLGAHACRILVPNYSEIYNVDDLVWDNSNKAIHFRKNILNIHSLNSDELYALLDDFDEYELDEQMNISELIGIAFEDSSPWGMLTILELKILIHLKVKNFTEAKQNVEIFNNFNENTNERRKYYQLLSILLDIEISKDLKHEDYKSALVKMYSLNAYNLTLDSLKGKNDFYGLVVTDMSCKSINKHSKLIDSYKKILKKRSI